MEEYYVNMMREDEKNFFDYELKNAVPPGKWRKAITGLDNTL